MPRFPGATAKPSFAKRCSPPTTTPITWASSSICAAPWAPGRKANAPFFVTWVTPAGDPFHCRRPATWSRLAAEYVNPRGAILLNCDAANLGHARRSEPPGPRPGASFRLCAHVCQIRGMRLAANAIPLRSEEHTSELQSRRDLVCRLLLEKKKAR